MNRYSQPDTAAKPARQRLATARQARYDASAIYLLALLPFGFFLMQDKSPSLITVSTSLLIVFAVSCVAHLLISGNHRHTHR